MQAISRAISFLRENISPTMETLDRSLLSYPFSPGFMLRDEKFFIRTTATCSSIQSIRERKTGNEGDARSRVTWFEMLTRQRLNVKFYATVSHTNRITYAVTRAVMLIV